MEIGVVSITSSRSKALSSVVLSPVADDDSVLSLPGVMLLEPPPYGGGGVPGGVILGESRSQPALLLFTLDKSDKDSDTINRFEAGTLQEHKTTLITSIFDKNTIPSIKLRK